MKAPLYRKALAFSWNLATRHTWLWPLGLFAAFLGQMGMLDLLIKGSAGMTGSAHIPAWLLFPDTVRISLSAFGEILPLQGWVWFVLLGVILVGLFATMLFVAVVSQGALVDMVAASTKRRKKFPDVGASWHVGVKHFWRIFFINILKKILLGLVTVSVLFMGVSFADLTTFGGSIFFYTLFFSVILIGMILSFLLVYAIGYIVVEEYSFFRSIAAAWKLFIEHPLVSLEVGLIMLFTNVVVGLLAFAGMIVLFLPAMILFYVSIFSASIIPFTIGFFMGFVFSLFYILFLGAVFTVFTTSAWTYLFMEMHKKGVASRFLRLFRL